jgi:hypothetical protein
MMFAGAMVAIWPGNMVTGYTVHARAELMLFAKLPALGTAKPVTMFQGNSL